MGLIKSASGLISRTLGKTDKAVFTDYTELYDEGTWTPTVTSAGGTLTSVALDFAYYIRVGKSVYFTTRVTITDKGTGFGALRITYPTGLTPATRIAFNAIEDWAIGLPLFGQYVDTEAYFRVLKQDQTTIIATGNGITITGTYHV